MKKNVLIFGWDVYEKTYITDNENYNFYYSESIYPEDLFQYNEYETILSYSLFNLLKFKAFQQDYYDYIVNFNDGVVMINNKYYHINVCTVLDIKTYSIKYKFSAPIEIHTNYLFEFIINKSKCYKWTYHLLQKDILTNSECKDPYLKLNMYSVSRYKLLSEMLLEML